MGCAIKVTCTCAHVRSQTDYQPSAARVHHVTLWAQSQRCLSSDVDYAGDARWLRGALQVTAMRSGACDTLCPTLRGLRHHVLVRCRPRLRLSAVLHVRRGPRNCPSMAPPALTQAPAPPLDGTSRSGAGLGSALRRRFSTPRRSQLRPSVVLPGPTRAPDPPPVAASPSARPAGRPRCARADVLVPWVPCDSFVISTRAR